MGQYIQSYSNAQLKNLAQNGAATPALFWAIPIGTWRRPELQHLWFSFTQNRDLCRTLGLLLARRGFNRGRAGQINSHNDGISDAERARTRPVLTGSLGDLIPNDLLNRIQREMGRKRNTAPLLILSGAWPQPGWGLVVDCPQQEEASSFIESTLEEVLRRLDVDNLSNRFECAQRIHRERQDHFSKRPDFTPRQRREFLDSESIWMKWRDKAQQLDQYLHEMIRNITELQWQLGPRFLEAFERQCRQMDIGVRTVAWDPASMVGWKLKLRLPSLQSEDLLVAANSVLPEVSTHHAATNDHNSGDVFGSLFADYAYYLALQTPHMSARESSRRLLREALSPGQLRQLLQYSPHPTQVTNDMLSEQVLEDFGWQKTSASSTLPLVSCIHKTQDTKTSVLKSSPLETRIALESCLKDLVLVCADKLGLYGAKFRKAITIHAPEFRGEPNLKKLTCGESCVLLQGVLPLAFPDSSHETIIQFAAELSQTLNPWSHDPPPPPPDEAKQVELAKGIQNLLSAINQAIGHLPWHLKPNQLSNVGPGILTGYAWSHSHAQPRLIRVIFEGNLAPREPLLIWNPSGGNPVMMNARILSGRGKR